MEPIDNFIARLGILFGEPKTENPKAFLNEYRAALDGYSERILILAGDRVRNTLRFWPRPAEIREIADAVAVELAEPEARAARERIARDEAERDMLRRRGKRAGRAASVEVMEGFRRFMAENVTISDAGGGRRPWAGTQRTTWKGRL
jgi:hypothetical protein